MIILILVFLGLCTLGVLVGLLIQQRNLDAQQLRQISKSMSSGQQQHGGDRRSDDEIDMAWSSPCDGPGKPHCTRHNIWHRCFLPLVDKYPRDGFVTLVEVSRFFDDHLRFYERWAAPSPATIVSDCDHPTGKKGIKGNGRVDWKIFNATRSSGCLGIPSRICMVRDVCDRELKEAHLPLTIPPPSGHKP